MAEFIPTTACSSPKVKDSAAVEQVLNQYYFDPDFNIGISHDHESGEPYLFLYGYTWPEAWKYPVGVKREDFDPYVEGVYEEGADGFIQLLKEIAPHLAEPLTVHAIGAEKCRFPLSACEWRILPGRKKVEINEFKYWQTPERVAAAAS